MTRRDSDRLEDLRTIGATTAGWLRGVGIQTPAQLRQVGAAAAFSMVAFRYGAAVNRNLLYALAGALKGRAYNSFSMKEKRRLCEQAGVPLK